MNRCRILLRSITLTSSKPNAKYEPAEMTSMTATATLRSVAGADGLGVGADGFGGFVGGDDFAGGDGEFFAHGGIVAGEGPAI